MKKESVPENGIIKTAIEKVRLCTEKQDVKCSITLEGTAILIVFDKTPSPEIVTQIKELVFFTNELVLSSIDSVFVHNAHTIIIDVTRYPVFVQMYNTLKDLKAKVFMIEVTNSFLEFQYTLDDKHDLNAKNLDTLQDIINPTIGNHDSIRVSYSNGVSTLCADLLKEKEHLD